MEPQNSTVANILKKVFCFLFKEKVEFRKVIIERFLEGFCSTGLRVDNFLRSYFYIIISYLQTTRKNPKPFLWRKKSTSNNFYISRYVYFQIIYNLSDFLWFFMINGKN